MSRWEEECRKKLIAPDQLEEWAHQLKRSGKSLVTLNGSFDLLHAGHVHILHEASQQGEVLLLLLNSDASIEQYKGRNRPLIPLRHRIELVAALSMVQFISWFDEPDPCRVLSKIKPDVHVNGAEYGEHCLEADTVRSHGGRLHLVNRLPGLATSEIIKKILVSCASSVT